MSTLTASRREPASRLVPGRKLVAGLAAGGLVFGLLKVARRAFPNVRARAVARCERMFEGMPESFPPKRLFADVEAIRKQNERMLELLEERPVGPPGTGD